MAAINDHKTSTIPVVPPPPSTPWRWGVVAGLLLLWLLPRLWMALKHDVICPDAVGYFDQARQIEFPEVPPHLPAEHFNLYPVILSLLQRAGFSPEFGGRYWGVLCGTLIALPLYGWVRRQFGERTALVACALAALHPKLIHWSPELVRDPTFCLFVACSLYAGLRAAAERSVGWFAATGAAVFAAVQIRFEGWFLLAPAVLWTVAELRKAPRPPLRLACGWMSLATTFVLLIWIVNWQFGAAYEGTILGGNLHKIAYLKHVPVLQDFFVEQVPPQPMVAVAPQVTDSVVAKIAGSAPPAERSPPAAPPSPGAELAVGRTIAPIGAGDATQMTGVAMFRGLGACFGFLLFCGLVIGRRRWIGLDQQAGFAFFALTILAVWIHCWESKFTTSRYAMPLVIVAAPYAALGALAVADLGLRRASKLAERICRVVGRDRVSPPNFATAGVLAIVGVITLFDAFVGHDAHYREFQRLGFWMRDTIGPDRTIVGDGPFVVTAYYADSPRFTRPPQSDSGVRILSETAPDVLLLDAERNSRRTVDAWLAADRTIPYRNVPVDELPPECRGRVIVLLREVGEARREPTRRL